MATAAHRDAGVSAHLVFLEVSRGLWNKGHHVFPALPLLSRVYRCTLESACLVQRTMALKRAAGDPEEGAWVLVGTQGLPDVLAV